MPYISEYGKDSYSELLASKVLDASKGALFTAAGLAPDTTNRTILIGVGGTGVRTIDYVKGAISKRLDATWKNYVAFLGIDASWTEFDQARYLEPGEKILTTQNGVANRMAQESTYPAATRPFMMEGAKLGALASDGSGRTRLVGKVKIHDQAPGSVGIDENIVNSIAIIKTRLAPLPAAGGGTYQVYVIGSVCGGTCSGSFLELPALIRTAINNRVKVHAMMYLPDTLATLDPANAAQLRANGYASLKELNYFMGMSMRPEYSESWSYNNPASPSLTFRSTAVKEEFIDIPYLIGTTNGTAADAAQEAMETIAEFLISLLAQINSSNGGVFLTSAFESNATAAAKVGHKFTDPGNPQRELNGEHHEFPKRFAAIGFAEASAPQKLVRAYTVGRICDNSGIKPVDARTRTNLEAAARSTPGVLIPFRGEDDLLNATVGTAKAREILEPLASILNFIHSGTFNFGQDLHEQDVTWTKIKSRHYDNPAIVTRTNNAVASRTTTEMMDALRRAVTDAFAAYRRNVQAYVREEGPYAFYNLYEGKFTPVAGDYGKGIGQMLRNLVDGNRMDGGTFNDWTTVNGAEMELNAVRNTINNTSAGPFGVELGKHKDQAANWVSAYNKWVIARINEIRRRTALGVTGALHTSFLLPAAELAKDIYAFGGVLESLASIYQSHGEKMESFEKFQGAQDSRTEVNLAAVNVASYNWLKQQADQILVGVNAHSLRDNLVDHFFAEDQDGPNTKKWLEVPQNRVVTTATGEIKLAIPDVAIPAREIFDKYLAENHPIALDVSIEEMFVQLQNAGKSFSHTANQILSQLANRSQPHVNGDIPDGAIFRYLVYPASLNSNPPVGPQIAAAIDSAAKTMFPGIGVYSSDDAESIMFYQMAAPFEIYRLRELEQWEKEYEDGNFGLSNTAAYLHGKSPDVVAEYTPGKGTRYVETMPWKDYPSITRHATDPMLPDPVTGKVCHEGQVRLKLKEMIEEARKLGVLYSKQDANGEWVVYRVHCDKTIQWEFDVMQCAADPNGLLPLGQELAAAIAAQNDNKTLGSISREVTLSLGGVFEKHLQTEEMAWEYALRVLRAHVPMYIEVRETLKKFGEWAAEIRKQNDVVLKSLLPAKMIHLVKGGVLKQNPDGAWVLDQNGKTRIVANLSDAMRRFLPPKDKALVESGLLGYYLFGKVDSVLRAPGAFDAAYQAAKANLNSMINNGDIAGLDAGETQAEIFLKEAEALQVMGAYLDGSTDKTPRTTFVQAMNKIGITNVEEIKEIDNFYYKLGLWAAI